MSHQPRERKNLSKTNKRPEPVDVPQNLLICAEDASIRLCDGEPESPKRFEMVAYTGGTLIVAGWRHPVVVDLTGLVISDRSRPVLKDHRQSEIVGHTDVIRAEGGQLEVLGIISGSGAAAREVLESGKNGFPWRASIGALPKRVLFVPKGHVIEANGQKFEGPIYVARESVLQEISFVAIGADDQTSVRVVASGNLKENSMGFTQWAEENGFQPETLDENNMTAVRAMFDARANNDAPVEPPVDSPVETPVEANSAQEVDPAQEIRARAASESRRISAIVKLCDGEHPQIEAQAIEAGWDSTRTELELLRASRPSAPAIHTSETVPCGQAIEAALCMASGLGESIVAESYDERTMDAALSRQLRGAGLHTLVYEVLHAAGEPARPGRVDDETIRAALVANNRLIQASSGFSTLSLSGILSNVANKAMLAAYQAVHSVAPTICASTDVNDFKEVSRYRMTGTGLFEKVGPDGELKHAGLSEESYTNRLDTYGRLITLTRQMIINDDLGAFLQIPRAIGRMSALALEEAVFTLLLSNPGSFFSAGNGNYFDGADSALDIDSLTLAEKKFLDRTDTDGKPILIQPAILLTGTGLKVTAEQLFTETQLNQVPAGNKAKIATNPHAGKFRPAASPYLGLPSLAGSSDNAWYLLADPGDIAFMEIAYLRGRRVPTIESGETDFNVLGIRWRGYFDFGVAMQDDRAAVKSKGEA